VLSKAHGWWVTEAANFTENNIPQHFILFYFILFYFILFYFILFYFFNILSYGGLKK